MLRTMPGVAVSILLAASSAEADTAFSDLTRAAIHGNAEKVEALLAWGANPNHEGWMGLSPLAAAMRTCQASPAVVYALLKAGADTETRSGMDETPLMLAWQMGRTDLAEMLLALGADPTARNTYGDTAREYELFFAGKLPDDEFQTLNYVSIREAPRSHGGPAECADLD